MRNREQTRRRARRSQNNQSNVFIGVILLSILLSSLAFIFRPWQHPNTATQLYSDEYQAITLGLDLRGGLRIELEPTTTEFTREDLNKVKTIVENRINALGVAEPTVAVSSSNRVIVEAPGTTPEIQQQVRDVIGKTAKLEFRIVKPGAAPDHTLLAEKPSSGGYKLSDLQPAEVTGEIIQDARAANDHNYGGWVVAFTNTEEGAKKFGEFTGKNIGKLMAVVLDDQIQSVATIQSQLYRDVQITGNFDSKEASQLALVLESGSLPIQVKTAAERSIGPSLGADAINNGMKAGIIGLVAIIIFLFIYYGLWLGLIGALGLIFSAIILMGILGGFGSTLTLPGIAGLVLTIGAAIDGNVISFERFKEEIRKRRNNKKATKKAYEHSTLTILDVNATHLISALALYQFSNGPVKGFAVAVIAGTVAMTISNLIFSKWMMETVGNKVAEIRAPQWITNTKIEFIKPAKILAFISMLLAIFSMGFIITKGFNYGVDFTSGTTITARFPENATAENVRSTIVSSNITKINPQNTIIQQEIQEGENQFSIKVPELKDEEVKMIASKIQEIGGQAMGNETVGPSVGKELTRNTIYAILFGMTGILIYICFRFDTIMGIGTVIATIHDVAIATGIFALMNLEFNISTVAAILTLIGYSLNDSIIISDRIRENLKSMKNLPYKDIVNISINQTLSRTMMTSISTMLPLLALLTWGGPVLRDFSLILLIGIFVGTYSSIYIVAPMVVWYNEFKNKKQPKELQESQV